jgi:hypothetical protein
MVAVIYNPVSGSWPGRSVAISHKSDVLPAAARRRFVETGVQSMEKKWPTPR